MQDVELEQTRAPPWRKRVSLLWVGVMIAALLILNQHCPSMLGFIVFQTGCDLQLTVGFFLASHANKSQAEIVMSFAQRIVNSQRTLQQIDRVRVPLLFER